MDANERYFIFISHQPRDKFVESSGNPLLQTPQQLMTTQAYRITPNRSNHPVQSESIHRANLNNEGFLPVTLQCMHPR